MNHTLVTGGRVDFWTAPVLVDGGGELGVEEVGLEAVWCAGVWVLVEVLGAAAGGVAWGLTGGGWTGAAAGCAAAWLCARAASEAISRGRRPLAREACGAGPIAAPTATPITSIVAASAALARVEGRRRALGAVAEGDADGAGVPAGGLGVWGVSVIVERGGRRLARLKAAVRNFFVQGPAPNGPHRGSSSRTKQFRTNYLIRIESIGIMICSALGVVKRAV